MESSFPQVIKLLSDNPSTVSHASNACMPIDAPDLLGGKLETAVSAVVSCTAKARENVQECDSDSI